MGSAEAPWPPGPQPCFIEIHPSHVVAGEQDGWMTYISPKTGHNESLAITTGPSRDDQIPSQSGESVTLKRWHWHDNGDGTGYTEPSIHLPGHYHSPYRTPWRITEGNPDGTWPKEPA